MTLVQEFAAGFRLQGDRKQKGGDECEGDPE